MKKIIAVSLCLAAAISFADRSDIWSAASVKANVIHMRRNVLDGGCIIHIESSFSKQDGGTVNVLTSPIEASGPALTQCMDILDTKAPALVKADQGL